MRYKCLSCTFYDNTSTYTDTGYCDLWQSFTHEEDSCEDFKYYDNRGE